MTIRSVSTVLIVALCIVAGQRAVSTQTAPTDRTSSPTLERSAVPRAGRSD